MSGDTAEISCIILAGGEGKRVGGVDKGLLEYKNMPLIEHVINIVSPQVDDIIISANRNIELYRRYSQSVISDEADQYLGPLAGIAAAMPHCRNERVLIVACDTPFLPDNIIERFLSGDTGSNLYIAEANHKLQLVMLINRALYATIKLSLDRRQLSLMQWARAQHPQIVVFHDESAFRNFNYRDDFAS